MALIAGAMPSETVVMNSLTANIHFMLVSFYKPTSSRFKIICEGSAFPSDQYALQTQVKFHGFNLMRPLLSCILAAENTQSDMKTSFQR